MQLQDIYNRITAPDKNAAGEAVRRWDTLAKPLGSLGLLEEAVVRMAALCGTAEVNIENRMLLVFCADNGVTAQGVTHCGSDVTAAVALSLGRGDSTVCHMARIARCGVRAIDVGIRDFPGAPGVLDRRVRNGTNDISLGPAMTREECERAILTGVSQAEELAGAGVQLLAAGEMGIGNTTACSAVVSVLLGLPAKTVTGRGSGLSDEGLARKLRAIRSAVEKNRPNPSDPVDVLHKLGSLDMAAMCGLFLGGAMYGVPVLADGVISTAAALCALRLCPEAKKAVFASHVSAEPAGALVLEALDLSPLITAGMRLGEGSGAVASIPLLDMALAVYHSGHSFIQLGIEPYTPQN